MGRAQKLESHSWLQKSVESTESVCPSYTAESGESALSAKSPQRGMLVLDENEDEKGDEDEPLARRSQSLQKG